MLVEVKYNTKCCSRLWKELPVDEPVEHILWL